MEILLDSQKEMDDNGQKRILPGSQNFRGESVS